MARIDGFEMRPVLTPAPLPAPQRRLARLYLWRAVWRGGAATAVLMLSILPILAYPVARYPYFQENLVVGDTEPTDLIWRWSLFVYPIVLVMVIQPMVMVIQARARLTAFRAGGGELSRERIAVWARRDSTIALDPAKAFILCVDILSNHGTVLALGYAGRAPFTHDPFRRTIRLGRLRPFWFGGSIRVQLLEGPGWTTRVTVLRCAGVADLMNMPIGEASRAVETVMALLYEGFSRHLAALDAARREQALERTALEARLHALQAQIEPHFLFNTLANLRYLIRTRPEAALDMLDHLSGYLQSALPDLRSATSTVRREAALAEHYLSIMRIRMGDRLRFDFDLAPAALDMPVPPAMLISLVENAIEHGLERATRSGRIVVGASIEGGQIVLRVGDDGIGLVGNAGQGVGLANIQERLKLLHGEAALLSVMPGEAGGVVATLRIPRPAEGAG
jgi:signal transduction histidine kinase